MTTATFVQYTVNNATQTAGVWRLSEPVPYGWDYEKEAPLGHTQYVWVSAVDDSYELETTNHRTYSYRTFETYIFACEPNGKVRCWSEMPGSIRDVRDQEAAIRGAGWEIA